MGLDADIYFRVKSRVPKSLVLPHGYDVMAFVSEWHGLSKPTHKILTCDRYFGPVPVIGGLSGSSEKDDHYTGFWPRISGALIALLATNEVLNVWYGSDSGEVGMWHVSLRDVWHLTNIYVRIKGGSRKRRKR